MDGNHVKAYIYDLSRGLARTMSLPLLGRQINGIWHTSIVVYNEEFFFGSLGIESCTPGCTILGAPDEIFDLGISHIPFELFMSYLQELAQTSYKGSSYHLLHHNCNNFTSDVAQFLTGRDIPPHITSLPDEVLSTPFGQMIKPFLDSMASTPGGGHVMFDSGNDAVAHAASAATTTVPQAPVTAPVLAPHATDSSLNVAKSIQSAPVSARPCDPVIFRPVKPSLGDVRSMSCCKGDAGALLVEAAEFIWDSQASWTISKCHFEAIATTLTSFSLLPSERIQLVRLLQHCICDQRTNDAWLLASSSVLPVVQMAVQDGTDANFTVACAEILCNMSSTEAGHKLVTSAKVASLPGNEKDLVELLCVSGLLNTSVAMVTAAAALSLNLSRYTISEDLSVALAGALLQRLGEVNVRNCQEEDTICHMLIALTNLGQKNNQVRQFIAIMNVGSNWPSQAGRTVKLLNTLRETCASL